MTPDSDGDGIPNVCESCEGGAASGDFDGDGSVSQSDYTDLEACLLGSDGTLGNGCECSDFDSDGDNDLFDFAAFQVIFTSD